MKRPENWFVALGFSLLIIAGAVAYSHPHGFPRVHAQALTSNQPQAVLVGTTSVAINQVVSNVACPVGVSTTELCGQPAVGTGGASGIAITSGNTGDRVQVMMTGVAICVFDNTPVVGDLAIVAVPGMCHDSGLTSRFAILNTLGIPGRVVGFIDSTHAWVRMLEPGAVGYLISATAFDPATVPAYVKANQTAQVNSDWSAVSGLAQILNKPTIPTTVTVNSVSCTLNSSCSIPVQPPDLTATTTLPGATLTLGGCAATVTVNVAGAVPGKRVAVQASNGALPATGVIYQGSVSSAGVVSAKQCAYSGLTIASVAVTITVGQ